jgi:hypothetical protein
VLRFQARPDKVLQAILHAAFEQFLAFPPLDDEEEWHDCFPEMAKVFTPQGAVEVVRRLMAASDNERVFQLTDYHWLVVYACLRAFCDTHNDFARDEQGGPSTVGPYEIGQIAFDAIVDEFFWDTDFLIEAAADVGPEGRKQMGLSAESFGIAAGLAPHPSELELKPWTLDELGDTVWPVPDIGLVPTYPPEGDAE